MKKKIFKFILILSIMILAKEIFTIILYKYDNIKEINSYYNNETSFNYKSNMILKIPSINLEMVVKKAAEDFNNLDKNLVYYKNNDYKKKIIIFGHSGMGVGTYFNKIDELENNNKAYIYIDKFKITYNFNKKYLISDTDINILNSDEDKTLLLITCDKKNKDKRLVVKFTVDNSKIVKK